MASPRVRSKKSRLARSCVGGQRTSTPSTSSSRTAAAGPTTSASVTGISASVSRLQLGSTGADSTAANTTDSNPTNRAANTNRAELTPVDSARADPTPSTRARSKIGVTRLYLTEEG